MIIRLLKKLLVHLPFRTIETDGKPYLTRWYVYPRRPRMGADEDAPDAKLAVFVHFFHRGDEDRDPHNHPWARSASLILSGGYLEERDGYVRTVKPGRINLLDGETFHRVSLLDPKKGCWTLFVVGPRVKEWGFQDHLTKKFIPWREYLAARDEGVS